MTGDCPECGPAEGYKTVSGAIRICKTVQKAVNYIKQVINVINMAMDFMGPAAAGCT